MTPTVTGVRAWEALDSRGHPTVGCTVTVDGGHSGRALVPTGASKGRFEVAERRDGGERYGGLGTRRAVAAIEGSVAHRLHGRPVSEVDRDLCGPSNVTLAVSQAAVRARAAAAGVEVWQLLAGTGTPHLPCPMVNVFSGGRHAEGGGRIQDFLAVPLRATTFADAVETVWRVRRAAAALVGERHGRLASSLVADEGGLAVRGDHDVEPLELLTAAIERVGAPVGIAIDVAATQIARPEEFLDVVAGWCARYPVVSVEDPIGDDDWAGWKAATDRVGHLQLVGDDLFATDATRVRTAAELGVANTVLVKPNQIGTLAGARGAMREAGRHGYATIVSARSGDTEDDLIADLAVGWDAGQIKIGSLTRSERLAKYNRLLEIEARHDLPYRGWAR